MTEVVTMPPGAALPADEVLARSGSNFRTAFVCLDAARREGMTAIYAFCRVADDAADDTPDAETGRQHIAFWREELHAAAAGTARTPVGQTLGATIARFGTDVAALDALLDGVAMDLEPQGCEDEAELRHYCDCVASAVGRACLPVLGATGAAAVSFANALGQALQFTNILRDLRGDALEGRVYAPRTWLRDAGVEVEWLRGEGPAEVYRDGGPVAELRARLARAARSDFLESRAALLQLPRSGRRALVPARIMGAVYRSLLDRLERQGGALVEPRTRVPKIVKLWCALRIFLGATA